MTRLVLALSAALVTGLAACATPADSTPPPTAEATPVPKPTTPPQAACDPQAAREVVGQLASADVVEKARVLAGAQIARTLKPGQMVTMEYHASRLNVDVNEGNVITGLRCG
jgi:hypothetical protein